MNDDPVADPTSGDRPDEQELTAAPSGLLWPFKRAWWAVEKHVLWPVSDSFRRIIEAMRYRSPLAYIGATALVCLTAGAVATAVYFYNEANSAETAPVVAEAPLGGDTVVAPVEPPPVAGSPAPTKQEEDTLQGVVPDFDNSARTSKQGKGSGGANGGGGQKLPETVVRPAEVPDSPPLQVAHRFANTFVKYEVGGKKAAKRLRRNATAKLAGELAARPPRLPANGKVPVASVLNVVPGKRDGRRMEVSVSLIRSGATSELRLALTRNSDKRWLVSEVRG